MGIRASAVRRLSRGRSRPTSAAATRAALTSRRAGIGPAGTRRRRSSTATSSTTRGRARMSWMRLNSVPRMRICGGRSTTCRSRTGTRWAYGLAPTRRYASAGRSRSTSNSNGWVRWRASGGATSLGGSPSGSNVAALKSGWLTESQRRGGERRFSRRGWGVGISFFSFQGERLGAAGRDGRERRNRWGDRNQSVNSGLVLKRMAVLRLACTILDERSPDGRGGD